MKDFLLLNLDRVVSIAVQAGMEIMQVSQRDFELDYKNDGSPLTEADKRSHAHIIRSLMELTPAIPILSEESSSIQWAERKKWKRYWLVDPLDGTKEFLKKNGEYTVNIALVEKGRPIWGVVHAPSLNLTYHGGILVNSSVKVLNKGRTKVIKVSTAPNMGDCWKIVGSRSHKSKEFAQFLKQFSNFELIEMGSSLKICLVAEGKADLYPRLGLTSEWDTAAADAILRGAGGYCLQVPTMGELEYNSKSSILNPYFICCSQPSSSWSESFHSLDL
ncbi:3'(2'),5'-bisphosphate nucleotidase CysQ [Reinekea sp. G2M2-21]|uniref:3'(2'),5'-bisphosphate nucleotidase CysQ n=1 Tax=Reinekea sp. G2M2-21 TaxID=2788942 RepID=UPI00351C723F